MRLGVVGCGRITERGYVPAALAAEGVAIAAFADPNAERLELCRDLWREGGEEASGYPDLTSLLKAEPVDLVAEFAAQVEEGQLLLTLR